MRLAAWVVWTLSLGVLIAQNGTISGVVAGARGPLDRVEVRVRAGSDGPVQEFTTKADGTYTFTVAAGAYDVFAAKIAYGAFTKRGVAVAAGANVKLDIAMNAIANEGVPGEFSYLEMRARTAEVAGAVPRMPDGKPDLSGVWFPGFPLEPDDPVLKPSAGATLKQNAATTGAGDPRAHCLPSGVPRTNNADLTKFVQTKDLLVILVEGAPPGYRQVFLGGKHPDPNEWEPSWMGHSIGKWDGDTLVIDTVGFHDRGWIDGAGRPQTEQLHVVERFHRIDRGTMEVKLTIDDPGAYEKPWGFRRELKLAEGEELREYVCNENEKTDHYAGK